VSLQTEVSSRELSRKHKTFTLFNESLSSGNLWILYLKIVCKRERTHARRYSRPAFCRHEGEELSSETKKHESARRN